MPLLTLDVSHLTQPDMAGWGKNSPNPAMCIRAGERHDRIRKTPQTPQTHTHVPTRAHTHLPSSLRGAGFFRPWEDTKCSPPLREKLILRLSVSLVLYILKYSHLSSSLTQSQNYDCQTASLILLHPMERFLGSTRTSLDKGDASAVELLPIDSRPESVHQPSTQYVRDGAQEPWQNQKTPAVKGWPQNPMPLKKNWRKGAQLVIDTAIALTPLLFICRFSKRASLRDGNRGFFADRQGQS